MNTSGPDRGSRSPGGRLNRAMLAVGVIALLVVLIGGLLLRPFVTRGSARPAPGPGAATQEAGESLSPTPARAAESSTTGAPTATREPSATPDRNTATPTTTAGPRTCTETRLQKGPTLILTGANTEMKLFWQWSDNSTFTLRWGTDVAYTEGGGSTKVSPEDTANHIYTPTITGLTPGQKYYYQISLGDRCTDSSFLAPPPDRAQDVKFFAYGDTRSNIEPHDRLAGEVVARFRSDPAFQTLLLDVGDFVVEDGEEAWVKQWFNPKYDNIMLQDASIADTGVRGNHEGEGIYFRRYFPAPYQPGGFYRSFDYGPMHVALIDQYTDFNVGSPQYNWLKADLAASNKRWKFVVMHMPGYSAGGRYPNNVEVQEVLQPLFKQYGVSVVFNGHNHYYARAIEDGIQHLTVGGGGAPLYTPDPNYPDVVATSKNYSYAEVTITGDTLSARVFTDAGELIDSFTITRP